LKPAAIALLCVFPLLANAETCPEDTLAYWKLDETTAGAYADEISAINTAGTCSLGCPTNTEGIDDNSASAKHFDGNNDGIAVAANALLDWSAGDSFSVELWVRRSGLPSDTEVLIARQDTDADFTWQVAINTSGQAVFTLSSGSDSLTLTGTKNLTDAGLGSARWHHVVAVRDAAAGFNRLYVDGEEEASAAATYADGFTSTTASLTIGFSDDTAAPARFDGDLDEIALYGRALDMDGTTLDLGEIKGHYYLARGYCEMYDDAVGIMPLGDSITTGDYGYPTTVPASADKIGYRLVLWELLGNNLYLVDFLGSTYRNEGTNFDFDRDHAGFPGIKDSQLLTLLQTGVNQVPEPDEQVTPGRYLDAYPDTEVILLHIGTNVPGIVGNVTDLLEEIDVYSENITVVLAQIIERSIFETVDAFNSGLETMANSRISQGDKIILVDMQNDAGMIYSVDTTAPYTGDMYDELHPNASGYSKMAGEWFETLETFLLDAEVPEFTSTAVTTVALGSSYTYPAKAVGPPDPTYSLVTNPAGMTVDAQSGQVQWDPPGAGSYEVTLRATNRAGTDDQSFTVTVSGLPQAQGDSYTGILEGGTLTVAAADGVLDNDTIAAGTLTAELVTGVARGTLTLNPDGAFTYTHNGSETVSDSFTYKATFGTLESETVTVSLEITPQNDAPTITGQGTLTGTAGEALQLALANLVFSDPDNTVPTDHSLIIDEGDDYAVTAADTIVPDAGFSGDLTVTVRVTDGSDASAPFDLTISVTSGGSSDGGDGDDGDDGDDGNDGGGGGGGGGCFIGTLDG
jgi:VCBS repeat-containing protein